MHANMTTEHDPLAVPPNLTDVAESEETEAPEQSTIFGWLRETVPTLLILFGLGGLAFWGHHTGWSFTPGAGVGAPGAAQTNDGSAAHHLPESQCVECNPKLMPRGTAFGWCTEHGVHECPLCHPEVAQLKTPPQITAADREQARRALAFAERPQNSSQCKLHRRRLQFSSEEAVQRAGVDVDEVGRSEMIESVPANGEISYDHTRLARLSSRAAGSVWWAAKKVGDPVRRGDILALVDAADVGRAKAEFLQAFAQVDLKGRQLDNLRIASGAIAARTLQEAEATLREARIRLLSAQQALINLGLPIRAEDLKSLSEDKVIETVQLLGLPDTVLQGLDPRITTANLLPLRAPLDGLVVAREVVAGAVVDMAKVLFVIADTRQMWLTLDVRLEDAKLLKPGQRVGFRPDGSKQDATGRITWVSSAADEKTRTVKVRAELANDTGRLLAQTFASGRVVLREEKNAIVIPKEAVHWEGCCHVVFVRDKNYLTPGAPKVFHVREVVPGASDEKSVEIVAGLLPGEVVATKGSGILRTELLKNNLGGTRAAGH